jgi:chemosensory pili system protein ChpA (sensor histidine kinase/response regulator)
LVSAPDVQDGAHDAAADGYKQIGPLRIGIALFNIYLNEADELSRRLGVELAEWTLEQHRPVGDAAVALAHSLAGSSGTVGFADLSQLARLLEHALERAQARGEGRGDEAALFVQAADEIRRLLHLFAAGFLHAPDPDLVRRLSDAAHAAPDAPVSAVPPQGLDDWDLDDQLPSAMPVDEPVAARPDLVAAADNGLAALGRAALLPFAGLAEIPVPALRRDPLGLGDGLGGAAIDEDIDDIDAVDEELFPIFTEEAQDELLPQLHASLRDWSRRPGDAAAPSACMRCLHTLKGSARLAGAMRLGEIAHRLETAVAHLAAEGAAARAVDVELLIGHADTLQACFDALQAPVVAAVPAAAGAPAQAVPGVPPTPPAPVPATPAPAPAIPVLPTASPVVASSLAPASASASASEPALGEAAPPAASPARIDWSLFAPSDAASADALPAPAAGAVAATGSVRVRTPLLDRLVNQAGEVSIARSRIESDVGQLKGGLLDLTDNLERLRAQLRELR